MLEDVGVDAAATGEATEAGVVVSTLMREDAAVVEAEGAYSCQTRHFARLGKEADLRLCRL